MIRRDGHLPMFSLDAGNQEDVEFFSRLMSGLPELLRTRWLPGGSDYDVWYLLEILIGMPTFVFLA